MLDDSEYRELKPGKYFPPPGFLVLAPSNPTPGHQEPWGWKAKWNIDDDQLVDWTLTRAGNTLASDANGPGSTLGGTLKLDTG